MLVLLAGLLLFLGVHSVRLFADPWRTSMRARVGELPWKGAYAVLSLVGFVLIVRGFSEARYLDPLWTVPLWTRHVAALLTLPAFILLAAAYVPGTRIKARVGHPMVLSVKIWAIAHLIANGRPASVLIFAAFLAWSVWLYIGSRKRDRVAGTVYPVGPVSRDVIAVTVGVIAWAAFAMVLHGLLIGVKPFGPAA